MLCLEPEKGQDGDAGLARSSSVSKFLGGKASDPINKMNGLDKKLIVPHKGDWRESSGQKGALSPCLLNSAFCQ